jgi:hypothetical protein
MLANPYLVLITTLAMLAVVILIDFLSFRESPADAGGRRSKRTRYAGLIVLVASSFVVGIVLALRYNVGSEIETKGVLGPKLSPQLMIVAMYVSMVFGTIAQSFFFAAKKVEITALDWIKPVLVSPIIFIPLLSSYENSLTHMDDFGIPELMILLFSFQNGFFWKAVFDKQAELFVKHGQTSSDKGN